jgi:hypothetical protein
MHAWLGWKAVDENTLYTSSTKLRLVVALMFTSDLQGVLTAHALYGCRLQHDVLLGPQISVIEM